MVVVSFVHFDNGGDHFHCTTRSPARNRAHGFSTNGLRAALLVPVRTPVLDADVDRMGLQWEDLGGGYWQVRGGRSPLYVAEIDIVTEQEDDDVLRLFSHEPERTVEGRRFWADLVGMAEARMAVKDMDGYDEVMQKFLSGLTPEQRLAGLAPEQRVAGLAPEQRVAGLAPEQRVAGLTLEQILLVATDDMLRGLPEDVVRSIEAARSSLRQRAGR